MFDFLKKNTPVQEDGSGEKAEERVYFISFPGILLRCLILSLLCSAIIFSAVIVLSLASFFVRQFALLSEAGTCISDTISASIDIKYEITNSYDEDLCFMEYQYNELKKAYENIDETEIYASLMDCFSNSKAAVVSSSGKILASSRLFDPMKYTGKIDQLDYGVTNVRESRKNEDGDLDEWAIIYRRLGDDTYGLFQYDTEDTISILSNVYSLQAIVNNKSTEEEYILILDEKGTILCAPKAELIGKDLSCFGEPFEISNEGKALSLEEAGINSKFSYQLYIDKENNRYFFLSFGKDDINGMKIYNAADIIPTLKNIQKYAVLLSLFLFAILLVQSAYVYYNRQYRDAAVKSSSYTPNAVRYKTFIVTILGMIAAVCITYYSYTMFSLSNFILNTDLIISDLSEYDDIEEFISDEIQNGYAAQHLRNAYASRTFLSRFPQFLNRKTLEDIEVIYDCDYIVLYDREGNEILASNTFTNLSIKDSKTEHFPELVNGRMYVIGEAQADEWAGQYIQPIGVLLLGEDGTMAGILEFGFNAYSVSRMNIFMAMDKLINQLVASGNTSVFVIDPETMEIIFAPEREAIGKNALQTGFKESQLKNGFTGEISFENTQYYVTSKQTDSYLVFGGVPSLNVFVGRSPMVVLATFLSFLNFQLILFHMRSRRKKYDRVVYAGKNEKIVIPPELKYEFYNPDLRSNPFGLSEKQTRTFSLKSLIRNWKKKVPEEKVFSLLKLILFFGGLFILLSYIRGGGIYNIINYSLDSTRGVGFNVYALTSIFVIAVIGLILLSIVVAILNLLAQLMRPRGETICRLLKSTIELFAILIIIYICLARLGFDIKMLVASAGLMGLVISMGARDLIVDILAGLFIIFEGDFQVGDIIDIGNFSGMVKEIGIRTTKIVSWNKNIKIVNNRNLSSVVNLSERNSFAIVEFSVPNSVDAAVLEQVMNTGLADMRKKYPQLLGDPYFKGVRRLAGGKLECRVVAEVAERWRGETEEKLNEEIQAILRDNNIPLS